MLNHLVLFSSTYGGRVYRSSNFGESFGGFFDNNIDRNNDGNMDRQALFIAPSYLWEKDNSSTFITPGNDTVTMFHYFFCYFLCKLVVFMIGFGTCRSKNGNTGTNLT
mgnify:CR=1 FL=1